MKKPILILILCIVGIFANPQNKNPHNAVPKPISIEKKWNIVQVELQGKLQDIQVRPGEKGPYIWLKNGGEVEVDFYGAGKGKWKWNEASSTLTIIEPNQNTDFIVTELTQKQMVLKPKQKGGELDPTLFVLKPDPEN